jgi:ATP-binding cassette subfamily F protein 3
MESQNEQLDAKIAQLSRFVERFGAKNTKAAQAQSKKKQIARLKDQRVVIPRKAQRIRFHFPNPPHAGRTLVRLKDVAFGYDAARDIFGHARVELERADKVAIVGANGAGKTTLLRVLAGQLAPREGERETWPHTKLAYFAQHAAETLEPSLTVLQALEEVAPAEWRPRLRTLLGNFLFQGDDVFKICRVLSGGERQRVALARLLMSPTNLILLDEPTHHLDLAGKEVLEDALEQYPGSVVVVTHDRSLMARVASRVIEVNDGKVVLYPGGYDDYESTRIARINAPAGEPIRIPVSAGAANSPQTRGDAGKPRAAKGSGDTRPKQATGDRKREKEIARLEKEIESREARAKVLEAQLADPDVYHDGAKAKDLVGEYERTRAELESLWQRIGELG